MFKLIFRWLGPSLLVLVNTHKVLLCLYWKVIKAIVFETFGQLWLMLMRHFTIVSSDVTH